jgi:hypothetical protein
VRFRTRRRGLKFATRSGKERALSSLLLARPTRLIAPHRLLAIAVAGGILLGGVSWAAFEGARTRAALEMARRENSALEIRRDALLARVLAYEATAGSTL